MLAPNEQEKRRQEYAERWAARFRDCPKLAPPMPVHHLNDNPAARLCWNASSDGAIGSPRTCMGPLWLPELDRPMLVSERLECMGFSTDPALTGGVFAQPDLNINYTRCIGNVMHAFCCSAMLVVMLACVSQEDKKDARPAVIERRRDLLAAFTRQKPHSMSESPLRQDLQAAFSAEKARLGGA